jgi:hypothetical protein
MKKSKISEFEAFRMNILLKFGLNSAIFCVLGKRRLLGQSLQQSSTLTQGPTTQKISKKDERTSNLPSNRTHYINESMQFKTKTKNSLFFFC